MRLAGVKLLKIKKIQLPYEFTFIMSNYGDKRIASNTIEIEMVQLWTEELKALEDFAKGILKDLERYEKCKEKCKLLRKIRGLLSKYKIAEVKKDAIYCSFDRLPIDKLLSLGKLEDILDMAVNSLKDISWNKTLKLFPYPPPSKHYDWDRAFKYLIEQVKIK